MNMRDAADLDQDAAELVQGCNQFALAMYANIAAAGDSNLIFSPSNLASALAISLAGASGETAREMAEALHVTGLEDRVHEAFHHLQAKTKTEGVDLRVVNRLWGQQGYSIRQDYLERTRRCYGSELAEVDFVKAPQQACQAINQWVEEQTSGKIQDLVTPEALGPLTRLVITNAVYFRGTWEHKFEVEQTVDAPFKLASGELIDTPMMRQSDSFCYGEWDDLQVLELRYLQERGAESMMTWDTTDDGELKSEILEIAASEGSDFAMCILLPRPGVELAEIERRLSPETLRRWLDLDNDRVNVQLPRFRLDAELDAVGQLKELGVHEAFDFERADFSGITTAPDGMYVEEVFHKAFIEVNEEGTEAAAATGIIMAAGCAAEPDPPKEFCADRPFLFLLYDRATQWIYFLGRVVDPSG